MQVTSFLPIATPEKPERDPALLKQAKALETAFLAEMLGHAGIGAPSESGFTGGIGEEQFSSFLREAQAKAMVEKGGIGLAECLFRALSRGTDEHG